MFIEWVIQTVKGVMKKVQKDGADSSFAMFEHHKGSPT